MSRPLVSIFALTLALLPLFAIRGVPAQSRVTIAGSVVDATLTPLAGVAITVECAGTTVGKTTSDSAGQFTVAGVSPGACRVRAERAGFPSLSRDVRVPAGLARVSLPLVLTRPGDALPPSVQSLDTIAVRSAPPPAQASKGRGARPVDAASQMPLVPAFRTPEPPLWFPPYTPRTESYAHVDPNRFHATREQPLSTFGADVDTASYTNVRRFLSIGQLPPPDAVRVEELINYFRFSYAEPRDGRPIAITTETGDCPWAPSHKLVLIGARAKAAAAREAAGRNIVLLIDVSGSMAPSERLPLIKTALAMFVDTLRPEDRIGIVTYAGTSGVALPSTPVRERSRIHHAIDALAAGGSTNGAQGLILAYRLARESFVPGGVNRVILATDGDFNVGIVDPHDLLHLIERERESGVFLSVFGVGTGNLKDSTMEMLADRGNGQYAYLDTLQEARRVLVRETDATLETVAKDVKFQVEFNPAVVSAWKLIGYENRRLSDVDFNEDRKDAGELGAGQTVTVLYEVVPAGAGNEGNVRPPVDPLRYQNGAAPAASGRAPDADSHPGEWLTVKVRYKTPDDDRSQLLTQPVHASSRAPNLAFASAIAEFGLMLRDSSGDDRRWDTLSHRTASLSVSATLAADKEAFSELVAIASSLSRAHGRLR